MTLRERPRYEPPEPWLNTQVAAPEITDCRFWMRLDKTAPGEDLAPRLETFFERDLAKRASRSYGYSVVRGI